MSKFKIYFIALMSFPFFVGSPPARAVVDCPKILLGVKASVGSYLKEVYETKGARLLVIPEQPDDFSAYGFLRHEPLEQGLRPWRSWLTLKPVSYWIGEKLSGRADARFTPANGVWSNLIDRPTHWVTRIFSKPKMRPTLLANMPLILGLGLLSQVYLIDPVTDFAFHYRIQSEITRNQATFTDLIQNDFRFQAIKKELERGDVGPSEANLEAYMVSQAYAKYYAYRDGKQGKFTLDENLRMLDHYLFLHLKPVVTGEIEVPEGFVKTPSFRGKISDEQRDQLFQQTHALYLKYQLAEVYSVTLDGQGGAIPTWFTPYLDQMRQDTFVATLTQLRANSKISSRHLTALLMENDFWAARIASWQTLGLSKINPETGQPVVLADYQAEMLKSIPKD